MHLRRLFAFCVSFSFCSSLGAATGPKASICGYLISEHDPKSVIGRIATAAMEINVTQTFFPTVATLSVVPSSAPESAENHIVEILDGTIRVGQARFSDGTIRGMENDLHSNELVRDVDVTVVHLRLRAEVAPRAVTALVDAAGDIHLVVDKGTQIASQIARQTRQARDHYGFALPSSPHGKFIAVAMVETSVGNLRLYGLTEQQLFSMDVDLLDSGAYSWSNAEWKKQVDRKGARFVRAISKDYYLIADESGNVEFYRDGSHLRTERVPGGWLSSISAYSVPGVSGLPSIRFAALSYSTETTPTPMVHLWKDGRLTHVPLDFPQGEAPVALAFTGMSLTAPQIWSAHRQKAVYESGYLSEWNVTDGEVQRLLIMSRRGNNYLFRGVQGWNKELKLSAFPWYYIGQNYSELEKHMIQAGFDFTALREVIEPQFDIGAQGQKLATRLRDGYDFVPFDPTNPADYTGSPESIIGAWRNRLGAIRDLRLPRSGVSRSITEEGIFERRDQLLVYELMNLEEKNRKGEFEFEELAPLSDREWMDDFLDRLTSQTSPLVQSSRYHHQQIQRYYDENLKEKSWMRTNQQNYDELPEPLKPLYLISREYLERPFKYLVSDYLRFSTEHGGRPTQQDEVPLFEPRQVPYWEMLANYLDSIDPLRAVTDTDSLIRFLTDSNGSRASR
jgi:hypothetical protein